MSFHNPLRWPVGWPRTDYPVAPTFKAQPSLIMRELESVLDQLDATSIVITTNNPLRFDGGLKVERPEDPGIALYFTRHGREVCIPCDKYWTTYGNLRAIGLTLEYIRRMERYGTSQMVDAAFRGFTALPASIEMGPGQMRTWHEVLEVSPSAGSEVIRAAYRKLSGMYHPDNRETGDNGKFLEVQKAYKESEAKQ